MLASRCFNVARRAHAMQRKTAHHATAATQPQLSALTAARAASFSTSSASSSSLLSRSSSLSSLSSPSSSLLFRTPIRLFHPSSSSQQAAQQQEKQPPPGNDGGAAFSEEPAKKRPGGFKAFVGMLFGSAVGFAIYSYWPEVGPDEWFWDPVVRNIAARFDALLVGGSALLPAQQLDAQGRRQRTLVIGTKGVIMHMAWSRTLGWDVTMRNGLGSLLHRAQRAGWEVVLWAHSPQHEIEDYVVPLAEQGLIKHQLFSDNTSVVVFPPEQGGRRLVKDLTRLDRDPNRLIVLDFTEQTYGPFPDKQNIMKVTEFNSSASQDEAELTKIATILEDITRYNVHDVSSVVKRYNEDPNADLFVEQRDTASNAVRHLKGDKNRKSAMTKGGLPAH